MGQFYNYDTRGASQASQMIWMEGRIRELEESVKRLEGELRDRTRVLDNTVQDYNKLGKENARLKELYDSACAVSEQRRKENAAIKAEIAALLQIRWNSLYSQYIKEK